jgi:hypothetical protein
MTQNARAPGGNGRKGSDENTRADARREVNRDQRPAERQQTGSNNFTTNRSLNRRSNTIKDFASCEFDGQLSDE